MQNILIEHIAARELCAHKFTIWNRTMRDLQTLKIAQTIKAQPSL